MNLNSPKSEPKKSIEKFNDVKVDEIEIASKPTQKPNDKNKNKIERSKIDIKKETRNKIQREKNDLLTPSRNKIESPKFNPKSPTRNKIEPRKIDPKKEPKHKIQPRLIDPKAPPRHKIEPRQTNLKKESKNKLQTRVIDPKIPLRIKNEHQFVDTSKVNINNTSSIQNGNKYDLRLERIKGEIKNLNWTRVSDDWSITTRTNQYVDYKKIPLDPNKDVSKENPLYRHKEWLNKLYNNKNWKLSDKDIANLCSVDPSVIGKWRKKHQISRKLQGEGRWLDKRSGKVYIRVPRDIYNPGLTKDTRRKSVYKLEHIHNMEKYLSQHLKLEISKKYLVDGKYLSPGVEIHHINQIGNDNRIKNLWIYESKKEHAKGELTLYESLKTLINTNHIQFRNGKYFLNPNIDSSDLNPSNLGLERKNQINFKDINLVKEEIKKINWNAISNDWSIQINKNQFVQKTLKVDPTRDCTTENPLHLHKDWVKRIVSDNRFNLTDSRLAKLCGITRDTARYWRERKHGIKGKSEWGFERRVDDSDGRIWIKVPKEYANPVVQKENHHRRFMLEHRYVIEQHLANHLELEISKKCLIEEKYLKTEAHVHHINLNYQDNRIENLWVFENDNNHKEATKSLYNLLEKLLKSRKIKFKEGNYHIDN